MLGHVRGIADARVVEHAGLPCECRVLADPANLALRIRDEVLVAELEIAAARVPAEPPGGQDLRAPPRRELRDGPRLRPGLAREARGQLEEGKRGVAAVADKVDPPRVREEAQMMQHPSRTRAHIAEASVESKL